MNGNNNYWLTEVIDRQKFTEIAPVEKSVNRITDRSTPQEISELVSSKLADSIDKQLREGNVPGRKSNLLD